MTDQTFIVNTNNCPFPYGTEHSSCCKECWYNGPKYSRRLDITNFMGKYFFTNGYYDVFMRIKALYLNHNPNKEQEALEYAQKWIVVYNKLYIKGMIPIDEDGKPYFMSSCSGNSGGGY